MAEGKGKTLAEWIVEHQGGIAEGESLVEKQVANDRRINASYKLIRDALERPDVKGRVLIDGETERAYFMNAAGLVAHAPIVWSHEVAVDHDSPHPDDRDTLVTLGEAS